MFCVCACVRAHVCRLIGHLAAMVRYDHLKAAIPLGGIPGGAAASQNPRASVNLGHINLTPEGLSPQQADMQVCVFFCFPSSCAVCVPFFFRALVFVFPSH